MVGRVGAASVRDALCSLSHLEVQAEQMSWCCKSVLPVIYKCLILRRMPESYWQNPTSSACCLQYPCACPRQYQRIMAYFTVSHPKSRSSDFHCHNLLALWKFGKDSSQVLILYCRRENGWKKVMLNWQMIHQSLY